MATSVAKDTGRRASDGKASVASRPAKAGRDRLPAARGLVIAAILVLLALEACIFQLAGSKGSRSWQAGYAVGAHLGRAAAKHRAGRPTPDVPREKDCVPNRHQLDSGIRTRRVVVAPHQLDSGDFHEGCVAGYQVAVSGR